LNPGVAHASPPRSPSRAAASSPVLPATTASPNGACPFALVRCCRGSIVDGGCHSRAGSC
jgi:hypothetical protein